MRKYSAGEPAPDYNFLCPYCNAPYCYLSADAYHYNYWDDRMDCYECGAELITSTDMKVCSRILTFPEPILEWKISPVEKMTGDIYEYIGAFVKTADNNSCVGLSAPEVGWNARVIVIDGTVMVNPRILLSSGEESMEECCICLPRYVEMITRAIEVVVEYTDLNDDYQIVTVNDPITARVIQHQCDHLDGKLILR